MRRRHAGHARRSGAIAAVAAVASVLGSGVAADSDPDGTFTDGAPPVSLSHTYSAPGSYDVEVEADDDHGGYALDDVRITVS